MDILVGGPEKDWAISQLKALLYLPSVLPIIHSRQLAVVFPICLVLWAFVIGIAIQKRKCNLQILSGLFVGIAQAIPFLSYTLNRYYPIHLVAIYLSLGAGAIAVISVIGRVETSQD
jgi:hypothetical protein